MEALFFISTNINLETQLYPNSEQLRRKRQLQRYFFDVLCIPRNPLGICAGFNLNIYL